MTLPPSDALVFFGATGDLAYKKIFPAFQHLIQRGDLNVPVVGVAKSGWDLDQLRARARASLEEHGGGVDEAAFKKLARLLHYIDGDYADPKTFRRLRETLGNAKYPTHYLAIPPSLFERVIDQLGKSGCADGARVVVEKPFGRDLKSAEGLNECLHSVFPESRVFRIDHYLGKDSVDNILYFRFTNTFLEPIWNRNYIDRVEITMAESFGIAGRGKFYDETGAIRDVLQNHLLQVLALLAMEPPWSLTDADAIRDEKVKVFRATDPFDPERVVRGQFEGYRDEPGVAPNSRVETFAAVRFNIDNWRWRGVPFTIRTGKSLPVTMTEARIQLKPAPLTQLAGRGANFVRFRLGPREISISIGARIKDFDVDYRTEPAELTVVKHMRKGDEHDAYARLLHDALRGDPALFVREDSVLAQWAIVEPVLGDTTQLYEYEPGTWGPEQADRLVKDYGGWHNPG